MATPARHVHTVRELNERISAAVSAAFPGPVWVRGEVQRLPADAARRTHVYFELHETGATGAAEYAIPVSIMGWDRQKFDLGRFLDGSDPDLRLENKLEVCFEAQVDFYAKFGKLSLKVVGVDKSFSLGRLEARRREVLAFLEKEGLLERNRRVPLPVLPLRVGLVTAPGSAAEKDFLTGLDQSPWGFRVTRAGARMQGERVQAEVTAAVARLVRAGVDVVVVTRGGGSRADLSWFDQQDLAVALATCPVPVVTAIGHEIDTSIADLVAHTRCKTPTAAADFLVERVEVAAARVDGAAAGVAAAARRTLETAAARLAVGPDLARAVRGAVLAGRLRTQRAGGRLQRATDARVRRAAARLAAHAGTLGSAARARTGGERRRLAATAARLVRTAPLPAARRGERLAALAKQTELLDPARLLRRGYSITTDAEGRVLRRPDAVAAGAVIASRLAEGTLHSVVQPDARTGTSRRTAGRKPTKGKKRGGEEEGGQQDLFR